MAEGRRSPRGTPCGPEPRQPRDGPGSGIRSWRGAFLTGGRHVVTDLEIGERVRDGRSRVVELPVELVEPVVSFAELGSRTHDARGRIPRVEIRISDRTCGEKGRAEARSRHVRPQ